MKLRVADSRHHLPLPAAHMSACVLEYLRASDYHVWIVLVGKNLSTLFYFPLFFFAPRGFSSNSITPTTLDTNTRPSSKMPRHRIKRQSHIGLGPTPPTLSWRLNCDKAPLFLQSGGEGEKISNKRWEGQRGEKAGERVDFGRLGGGGRFILPGLRSRSFCLYEAPINDDQQGK